MIPWKRGQIFLTIAKLKWAFVLAVALAGLVWTMQTGKSLQGPIGLFLGAWLVFGALVDLVSRLGRTRDFSRLLRLPRADWGKFFAHSGLGITMFGVAGLMAWDQEDIRVVPIGGSWDMAPYSFTLDAVENVRGPNYLSTMATVSINKDGEPYATVYPEKRNYPVAKMPTTEAAIDYHPMVDLYVVIGDRQDDGGWAVRTYIKPLANWIWAGAIIMGIGGLISLTDRRYRLAAGARKNAVPQGTPAE
jgi:cytochrome c-type biogenesis protein CcmF